MEIPERMRAVVLTGHGGLERLEYREDWPVPRPAPGEVLLEVGACGLNNTDVNTRIGWYAREVREGTTAEAGTDGLAQSVDGRTWGEKGVEFPRIQGADVCGRVVALGAGAPQPLLGRRVLVDTWLRDPAAPADMDRCGYLGSERDGGYAEYATVPAANVHALESTLTDAELATFATSSITAENMLHRAAVGPGDAVLIPGASGGVGSALVQLARRRGALPVAMCSAAKAEAVRAVGAHAVLEREPDDLAGALRRSIGRPDVDVVADVVGGTLWPRLIEVLRRGGRYTCAGAIAGPVVEFDLRVFYLRDLTFTGATVVPEGMFADLVGYIARGEIRPLLAATFPLARIREAQEMFLAKRHVGNIVVLPR